MKRTFVRILLGMVAVLGLTLIAACIAGLTYTPDTTIPAGLPGKHIKINGVPIRYVQQGAGKDILLIHGSSGSIEDWQPIFGELAKSYRVTAFDRPGHGFSGDVPDHSQENNARVAVALIKQLKLNDVLVVGHSYGGPIALLTATRAPERVHGVVVLDSALFAPIRQADAALSLISIPVLGPGLLRLAPKARLAAFVRKALVKEFRVKPPSEAFLEQHAQIWGNPKVLHSIAEETLGSFKWLPVISHAYPYMRKPLVALAQSEDPRRAEEAKTLRDTVPQCVLMLVPATGHFIHHEQTALVLYVIRKAVDEP